MEKPGDKITEFLDKVSKHHITWVKIVLFCSLVNAVLIPLEPSFIHKALVTPMKRL